MAPTDFTDTPYVRAPGWFTRHVLNRAVGGLTRRGLSVYGARILAVRGRRSGQWRRTPVNPLTLDDRRYLVAARGHVQWTHNLRAVGDGTLTLGRRSERFTATEVADADKPEILRAYLHRWGFEVGAFFDGVEADSSDEQLLGIASRHPVFRISRG
jgi:deazaflavin-dependent oxidoreductase (nitroreductase family)